MDSIIQFLRDEEAVITDSHLVLTSGLHSTAYINLRQVAHLAAFMAQMGALLGDRLSRYSPDLIIGPETLGRNLAISAAVRLGVLAIWCDIVMEDGQKKAVFDPKLNFGRLVPGKRVVLVDDLLFTGSSLRQASELAVEFAGRVVAAGVVVQRSLDVSAADCGAPKLEALAQVEGFQTFTPEECATHGPCFEWRPMLLRPGHGHEWIKSHPDYPVAA